MVDDFRARFRAAYEQCTATVFWHQPRTPAEVLRSLAEACDELGVEWDRYGGSGAVARLEDELTELFGTGGAAFFPSGVMAQQAALRVWCERAGTRRVAMPDLSHLLVHEQDGPRRLHGFEVEHLTTGPAVPTADALAAIPGRLAAVLVELPLRDAGCLLPTWDQLTDLSASVRDREAALHVDGARIWEAQPFWERGLPEIAALANSMYVSFYKGLGGLAGAALVGTTDFLDEARQWRSRMGGTLFRSTPEAVAALLGLRRMLPRMPELLAWARALAAELPAVGITPGPSVPHTPTFRLYATGGVQDVNDRVLSFMETERLQLTGLWSQAQEPGRVTTEVVVSAPALEHEPAQVARWLGQLLA